ncbi:hypothetical protein VT84_14180 [Gemmata sp. SH-PL17]|nr:hypothetical protein [Gemmata sp. SH-PL17]AMV25542.1 hypothetical protein VT84_14180 [Gemmata sp. SH-PL17]
MSDLKALLIAVVAGAALAAVVAGAFTLAQRGATGFGGTPTRTGLEQP